MTYKAFADILKEKRLAYQISQDKLAAISGFSCHYISNVETGKTIPTSQKQEKLLESLERLNPERPMTMLIDYVRIRFPGTDAKRTIEELLHIQMQYMLHLDYGRYSYEEQYTRDSICVMASQDKKKGILLELKGEGCRLMESYLNAIP